MVASLLILLAFVLVVAAYVPRNAIKQRLAHPMYLGIKVWAIAHLLANGRLGEVILFGVFLVWAIVGFIACKRRDRNNPPSTVTPVKTSSAATAATIVVGVATYLVFAMWLHTRFIGVSPFG